MGTDQLICCIVALLLGMLLFHMLKGVCGCKVVEGLVGLPCSTHEECRNHIMSNVHHVSDDEAKNKILQLLKSENEQKFMEVMNERLGQGWYKNTEGGMEPLVEGQLASAILGGLAGVATGDFCAGATVCLNLPGDHDCIDPLWFSTCANCADDSTCCQAGQGCR